MIIPHSQQNVIRLRLNYYLIYFIFAVSALIGSFSLLSNLSHQKHTGEKLTEIEKLDQWNHRFWIYQNHRAAIDEELDYLRRRGNAFYYDIWNDTYQHEALAQTQNPQEHFNEFIKPLEMVMDFIIEREDAFRSLPLGRPIEQGHVTSKFGIRLSPFGLSEDFHAGYDFANAIGTPIIATADGEVIHAGRSNSGYGNYVKILHKHGFITLYGHAHTILVEEKQKVKRGDVVATLGRSGSATGPHVHYEVRLLNPDPLAPYELHLNPLPYILENP